MAIYALGESIPTISSDAYVHPDAVVIGNVTLGAGSSVWPGAVLRGDDGYITIGIDSNLQDNAVLHTTPEWPTIVGDRSTIGHLVHLEGCTIESDVLVGNGSICLHRVVVRSWAIVAANAVVLADTEVPSLALAVGIPATIKPGRAQVGMITVAADSYRARAKRYRADLRRVD
jgi:carbonic anhydrase/acetyltransferase-like protein (isoleucine patch superfamily)